MLNDNEFTIEDIRSVAKRAKFLNTALIVVTLVYFVLSWVLNGMFFAFNDPTLVIWVFRAISTILAVIILIFSILTFGKMRFLKIEGGGQLLASSIIFKIFAFFVFLLGIVIFILSGMSIRKIKESMEIMEIEYSGSIKPRNDKNSDDEKGAWGK